MIAYAYNIKWDTDGDKKIFDSLPKKVNIPEEVIEEYEEREDEDIITDFLSDEVGFCTFGYDLHVEY